mgnify:CR=1 FL=1
MIRVLKHQLVRTLLFGLATIGKGVQLAGSPKFNPSNFQRLAFNESDAKAPAGQELLFRVATIGKGVQPVGNDLNSSVQF